MIIYGTRAKLLTSKSFDQVSCDYCQQNTTHYGSVFGKYFHVFWIPFFPIGKVAVSECQHCKRTLEINQTQNELRDNLQQLKSEAKAPIFHYSGLGVVAALAVMITIIGSQNSEEKKLFSQQPKAGDLYEIKSGEGYSMFKVANVSSDSLYVYPNSYEVSKITGLHKINKPENFGKAVLVISKQEILHMLDKGDILDINRP